MMFWIVTLLSSAPVCVIAFKVIIHDPLKNHIGIKYDGTCGTIVEKHLNGLEGQKWIVHTPGGFNLWFYESQLSPAGIEVL